MVSGQTVGGYVRVPDAPRGPKRKPEGLWPLAEHSLVDLDGATQLAFEATLGSHQTPIVGKEMRPDFVSLGNLPREARMVGNSRREEEERRTCAISIERVQDGWSHVRVGAVIERQRDEWPVRRPTTSCPTEQRGPEHG